MRLLAAGHHHMGHTVRVAASLSGDDGTRHPWVEAMRAAGVETLALPITGRAYLRERAAVADLCRRIGPTVVHSHGYRPDVLGAGAARSLGIPTVTTVHGFTGGDWKNQIYERLQRRAFRRFDAVAAVSRPLSDALAADGVPRTRLHLLPNAYDERAPRLDRAAARAALGVPAEGFRIGWVGRLSPEKGADVLLDAVSRITDLPIAVSVLGDGAEASGLRERAERLGIASRVTFHGVVRDAGRLFPALDLFVLSSRTEGTPIVLFEAMSAGVAIVATRVGGVPDVVSEAEASLVPPEDPASLAAAIRGAFARPADRAARAEHARGRLTSRFALAPWLRAYEAIYRGVASTRRPARAS